MNTITTFRLARHIMRKHGKTRIFTNKYKNCRTVKCYVRFNAGEGSQKLLNDLSLIPGTTFKVKETYWADKRTFRPSTHIMSLIVRCPN
jgi:hypothetical protein